MRRFYKLLSWDYETNRGLATDGTSWEGQPIVFDVYGEDLSPEYNGFLNLGEVFTAVESPARILYDIVIEQGPRSARPAQTFQHIPLDDNAVEALVNKSLTVDAQAGDGGFQLTPLMRLATLEEKVRRIERELIIRSDDHK